MFSLKDDKLPVPKNCMVGSNSQICKFWDPFCKFGKSFIFVDSYILTCPFSRMTKYSKGSVIGPGAEFLNFRTPRTGTKFGRHKAELVPISLFIIKLTSPHSKFYLRYLSFIRNNVLQLQHFCNVVPYVSMGACKLPCVPSHFEL